MQGSWTHGRKGQHANILKIRGRSRDTIPMEVHRQGLIILFTIARVINNITNFNNTYKNLEEKGGKLVNENYIFYR